MLADGGIVKLVVACCGRHKQGERRKEEAGISSPKREGGEKGGPGKKQSEVLFLTFGSSTFMSFYYGIC